MQADRFTVKSQEALAAAQRLAGARRNPEVAPPHLLLALLEQEGGIVVPVLRRAGADPERVRRRANEAADLLPTVTGEAGGHPRARHGADRPAQARRRRGARHGRRVRLERAPAARARGRPAASTPAPRATSSREAVAGGARPAPRHRPEPRGQVPGARDLRARPHRGGRAGQARPGDRARRRGPARDPGALAAHQEQPGPDRRAGRRQDRDRRGPRPAHRLRATSPTRCATGA